VEKISEAVGGIFRPFQIRRIAEAEADAAKIQTKAQIEISDLQRRAMHRFLIEEGQKQENIESITQKALQGVSEDARPENIERDWIVNFFDKGRLVSDDEMQSLWSRILAGEANKPGFCSKRTVDLLSSMDKSEAELFKSFCTFVWDVGGLSPLIYDVEEPIYNDAGISFNSLQHLELAGLINFDNVGKFRRIALAQDVTVGYYGEPYRISFPVGGKNDLPVGAALLTVPGKQLANVSGSIPSPAFRDYVLAHWEKALLLSVTKVTGLES